MKNNMFIASLFILMACTQPEQGFQGNITCLEIKIPRPEKIEDIVPAEVSEKHFIKLETTQESVFGHVTRLRVGAGRIFILDKDNAKGLFVFSLEGKYLFKIDQRGNGPGEFVTPNDFFVDTIKKTISIYDTDMRILHYYDWQGKYTHKHQFDSWLYACCPLDSNVFALDFIKRARNTNNFHLLLKDQENNTIFKYKPLKNNYEFANNDHIAFYQGFDRILYVPVRCDTIFELSNIGIVQGIYVNFGKHKLPENFMDGVSASQQARKLLDSEYFYNIKDVVETEDFIAFECMYASIGMFFIYNKNINKVYNALPFYPGALANYGKYFAGIQESYDIHNILKNMPSDYLADYRQAIGEENWSLFENIDESDNPIVCFYEIKKE
jgi:hypothetical protein